MSPVPLCFLRWSKVTKRQSDSPDCEEPVLLLALLEKGFEYFYCTWEPHREL